MYEWLDNPLINKQEIARQMEMSEDIFYLKYTKQFNFKFTDKEFSKLLKIRLDLLKSLKI